MARNAEKAMTALARWRRHTLEEANPKERRPFFASECTDVKKAIKFRSEITKEISKKISSIQNPGLGEFKIRDLNDEINKLIREKGHWEVRIKQLGGPNYLSTAPKWFDREGNEVPGMSGYKYFGAAKDLPGVREIIEKPVHQQTKKTRADLMKYIDADYYGYMDDDDGVLVPLEMEEEQRAIARSVGEYRARKEAGVLEVQSTEDEPDLYGGGQKGVESDEEEMDTAEKHSAQAVPADLDTFGQPHFIAHVPVPSQQEIEEALVRRKKMQLLDRYASESLIQQSLEARTLMGYEQSSTSSTVTAHPTG